MFSSSKLLILSVAAACAVTTAEYATLHGSFETYGKANCNGCVPDLFDPFIMCSSPYGTIDYSCDFKACIADEKGSCGTGTYYTGAFTVNYWQVPSDWTLYSATHSDLCTAKIKCNTGMYNAMLTCNAGSITERDGVRIVHAGGCDTPNPGTFPSGCRTCSNGGLDQFAPDMTNLLIQSCGMCPPKAEIEEAEEVENPMELVR